MPSKRREVALFQNIFVPRGCKSLHGLGCRPVPLSGRFSGKIHQKLFFEANFRADLVDSLREVTIEAVRLAKTGLCQKMFCRQFVRGGLSKHG